MEARLDATRLMDDKYSKVHRGPKMVIYFQHIRNAGIIRQWRRFRSIYFKATTGYRRLSILTWSTDSIYVSSSRGIGIYIAPPSSVELLTGSSFWEVNL